jgi:transcriptional regulator with XRE-family HTH domain
MPKEQEVKRRQELADFLRTRREKIKPAGSEGGRRRTPGLRREEVARLAGIGTTWYTWLEQAREIHPSNEVLERLGRALELTPPELKHLFALAGKIIPDEHEPASEKVPDALQRFTLDVLKHVPALVVGHRFDVLLWNPLFARWISDPSVLPEKERNWLWMIFCREEARARLLNWEPLARQLIAEFRSTLGEQMDNPWIEELIQQLRTGSPEFNRWWKSHDVAQRGVHVLERSDPERGLVQFERSMYVPTEAPKLKVIVYNPLFEI